MFTGIVEEIGTVAVLDPSSPQEGLVIRARDVLADVRPGDSIAVNGVCLTITRLSAGSFTAGMMPETLRRSNLGALSPGTTVNLERPVRPDTRLGGHFVQGHVDGTGTIAAILPDGDALAVRVDAPPGLLRYVVEKGFITVDGASLTVTGVDETGFSIALVPYTQEHLASGIMTVGHQVNIEVDVLAKYVEKLVLH